MGNARAFALNAVLCILTIVHELQEENPGPGKVFCTTLTILLEGARRWLERPSFNLDDDEKVWKLLRKLELLIQWPTVPTSRAYDSERAECAKSFPSLRKLQKHRLQSKKNIAELSICTKKHAKKTRWKIQCCLEKFTDLARGTKAGSDISQLLEAGRQGGEVPRAELDDIGFHIKRLYSSLLPYCVCNVEEERRPIPANIRLSCEDVEDGGVGFSLLFLDHPHNILNFKNSSSQWQDARICVYRRRGVKFAGQEPDDSNTPIPQLRRIEEGRFCEAISSRVPSLQLIARDGLLALEEWKPPDKWYSLNTPGVSLSNLLETKKLHPRMRLLLSYHLAKATWQFYDTNWMSQNWTKDNIYFMHRTDVRGGIFVNDPFFSASFDDQSVLAVETSFQSHRFPKILALGVMLIEIELGTKIEEYFAPEWLGRDGKPTRSTYHFAALKAFNAEEPWRQRHTFCFVREAIEACLIPDSFKPCLDDPASQRDKLYKLIVTRLGSRYEDAWADPEKSEIDPICMDTTSKTVVTRDAYVQDDLTSPCGVEMTGVPIGRQISRSILNKSIANVGNLKGAVANNESNITSDDWFSQLRMLTSSLRIKEKDRDSQSRPTRIGVLDTGISADFSDSRAIKDYEDFVGHNNDTYRDSTGHGTLIFRLVQQVYGAADVYIARVWEKATMTPQTPSLLAQAIDHAREAWEVDVIVIPSGFQAEYEDILQAIERAKQAHILVFAAASNYGNLTHIAFPGRLYKSGMLFCMFSTNAEARCFPHFNPTAVPAAIDSFAVLGQDIVLPNVTKSKSGTSYSTAIGAALAGLLLDFSRHPDSRTRIRRPQHLRRVEGMAAVFSRMSRTGLDNGYKCIVPWELIPSDCQENEGRKVVRERICDTISETLGRIW